jgi:hypothetical protein
MTTTPVILLTKRSGNAADRPATTTIQAGEASLCFGAAEPGVYFKDSAGSIRKVGPTHYGITAPNSTPVGSSGNSVGELWVDSSSTSYYLRIWNGTSFIKVGAGFADSAASALVTIASGAIVANSALVASGAFGAVLSSGVIVATGVPCADIYTGSLTGTSASGSLRYKTDNTGSPSGLYVAFAGGWALV